MDEDIPMAHEHTKKLSTPLVIREMKIKTSMTFHCKAIGVYKIKETEYKCWKEIERAVGTLIHRWRVLKMVQSL